ncbi:MAG: sialidase family protein [Cyanobacteria bacterium P01_E01_bin.6]
MNELEIESSQDLVRYFRDQAKGLRARATLFLWAIVGVVLGGVALVIALPPIIANVDHLFSDVQPPEVAEKLKENIEVRTTRLNEINQQSIDIAGELNQAFHSTGSVWTSMNNSLRGIVTAIVPTSIGSFIAAGWEGHLANPSVLIWRGDARGENWTPIRIGQSDGMLQGFISAISGKPDGSFIAVGREGNFFGDASVLILHSDERGDNWTAIRPTTPDGAPIEGYLSALTPMPDGSFMAFGSENSSVLILRSDASGYNWTAFRPTEQDGTPIQGHISAVTLTPDGDIIAVGQEPDKEEPGGTAYTKVGDVGRELGTLLLLRSDASGKKWTPIRPTDSGGTPLLGYLTTIEPTPEGEFIAAGWEGDFLTPSALILRSDVRGENWTPIRPIEPESAPQGSRIFSIMPTPEGEVIAVGSAARIEGSSGLILRSDLGGGNWTPVHLVEPDGTPLEGHLSLVTPMPGGELLAAGKSSSKPLIMHNIIGDGIHPRSELAPSEEQRDHTLRELDRIIEELERDDLLMPLELREYLPLAAQLKEDWEANFDERESLRENRDAIVKAWNESQPWQRISRIATRVAVIVLLIYLVQIMVNLFRYNTRLAAFYQARADAIDLLGVSNISLGTALNLTIADIATALSPDSVDFGKAPTPPSQQAIEIFRDVTKSARVGVS